MQIVPKCNIMSILYVIVCPRFIVTCQDLNHIDLSGCKLPPDVLKLLLSGISDNILLTEVYLNLSFCEVLLNGAHIAAVSFKLIN